MAGGPPSVRRAHSTGEPVSALSANSVDLLLGNADYSEWLGFQLG